MIYNYFGEIKMEFIENSPEIVSIMLYTIEGKNLYNETLNLQAGLTQHFIDVRSLPYGIYFIKTQRSNSKAEVKKIVLSSDN